MNVDQPMPEAEEPPLTMDHEMIVTLKAAVTAASEEFDMAVAFHALWKPATYDAQLHERMGRSYASQGLLVIRTALRREMVLALVRIWDTNRQSVRMSAIAETLKSLEVIDVLAADRAKYDQWPGLIAAMRADLKKKVDKVSQLVRKYQQGGPGHSVLVSLRAFRHERLAHRQLAPDTATVTGATSTDEEIEEFYLDNSTLVHELLSLVMAVSYDPDETGKVYGKYAKHFWDGARGERTEGHPNFRRPIVQKKDLLG
jgi:AbiU2